MYDLGMNDKELLRQNRIDELYLKYQEPLTQYIARLLVRQREMAADLVQDIFIKVIQKRYTFDYSREVRPWLFAMATYRAISFLRSNGRHPAANFTDFSDSMMEDGFKPVDRKSLESVEIAIIHEESSLVRKMTSVLTPVFRASVEAVYMEGLTYREAGKKLGVPVDTVKTRVHRGLKNLREMASA